MKRIYIFSLQAIIMLLLSTSLQAAFLTDVPMTITQPSGESYNCLASGDEFFNYLHDENGYTIIQDSDGFYYYAVSDLITGDVIPSIFKVGEVNPLFNSELEKNVKISRDEYISRRKEFNSQMNVNSGTKDAPTSGTVNNLSIFIRFSDEGEFPNPRAYYDEFFNEPDTPSLINYYKEVSFDTLTINTTHYPETDGSGICYSYQDSHPRAYFQPYNATTNPIGYTDAQRTPREHALLRDAVNYVSSEIDPNLIIDANGDGYVDNISFTISGGTGAWASLLWPHRWSLFSYTVSINGKQVSDYLFMLGGSSYYNVSTLCHEFFHVLGAPDLYHYDSGSTYSPAGSWDIMCSNASGAPQYMSAFMKYKYGDWINEIPVISEDGVYTLDKLGIEDGTVSYRIDSPNNSNEYFVVEFRKQEGMYESNLPGEGLLVWRIVGGINGNAQGPPDEVYLYRPGGTLTANGQVNSANFSIETGRIAINDSTDPSPFLSNGNTGGLFISEISSSAGETMSFRLGGDMGEPPSCEITNPINNASYTIGETIQFSADAEDTDGEIVNVKFYIDTYIKKTDSHFPYYYNWGTLYSSAGEHILKAVALDDLGNTTIDSISITLSGTGIDDQLSIVNYQLEQNYPNPFNPITKINYKIAVTNYKLAEIIVYNMTGQQVWSSQLTDHSSQLTGSILFDGSKFNSGIYYYSLIIDGKKIDTKAMVLIK